jgi:hypothetical protein
MKSTEIFVPANEIVYAKGFCIIIPKKIKYYNQNWQCIVKIQKRPNPGVMMNLEVILPLWIETERKNFLYLKRFFIFGRVK